MPGGKQDSEKKQDRGSRKLQDIPLANFQTHSPEDILKLKQPSAKNRFVSLPPARGV